VTPAISFASQDNGSNDLEWSS